jgi:hypothetical protein
MYSGEDFHELTSEYINSIVSHFIELNGIYGIDTLCLGNLKCVLRLNVREMYTNDNFHKIRVFVPLAKHVEKMLIVDNFNEILGLNNTVVILKNVMVDLMVSRHDNVYYTNLILFANDYEIICPEGRVMPTNLLFIDELDIFTNFVQTYRDELLRLINNAECQKNFLLLNKIEAYKTPNLGKIRINPDRQYNTESKVSGKVETYSIKTKSYRKSCNIDFYVIDDLN